MVDLESMLLRLVTLPRQHQTVFAACCVERMLPNYEAFCLTENWGDPDVLRQALDRVWLSVQSEQINETVLRDLERRCIDAAPDVDDFRSFLVGNAMRAASSAAYALQSCFKKEPVVHRIVNNAIESIMQYLHRVGDPIVTAHAHDPTLEEWIDRSPLMLSELAHQERTLTALQRQTVLDAAFIAEWREKSVVGGIQPMARGLIVSR